MTGHAAHLFAGRIPKNRSPFLSENMYRNVSAVTGACMCVRKELFESVGGFDENLALVFNDVEIGLRVLKKGYRIVYTPGARLVHYEGRSRAKYIPTHDIQLGAELLHPDIEMGDKYYNPNLSLTVNWPTLKRKNEPSALSRLEKIVRYKGIGK
jgi:cellulose synthase/poly-beta-1,6-N-acetylglucosamine synthase-like glycosyltransferase